MTVFDTPQSIAINDARLTHLASLNLSFWKRSVLEVGAGVGNLTKFFTKRRCYILSVEGRPENLDEYRRRHPERDAILHDLNMGWPYDEDKFDIVFCYGILYHLAHPTGILSDLAVVCNELFLLETLVWHEDDGDPHVGIGDNAALRNQSLDGRGCRPARDWLHSELSRFFPYVYCPLTQPDHAEFPLSFPADPSTNNRAIFIASHSPLSLSTLTEELPTIYARHTV